MSRQDYERWKADGRPFTLMRPLRELRDVLRGHGYTVYDIGNDAHMLATPAEDHTPFSETGWPAAARYGIGYAIDVMPPKSSKLPTLAQLGARLHADRQSGRIGWLKYMNWQPDGASGRCIQCAWKPDHRERSSSDRGHIHVSGRTGWETKSGGGYDPVALINGGSTVADDDTAKKVHAVFTATFHGGSSCGRVVDPDGTGGRPATNGIIAKLDYLMAGVDKVAAAVARDQVDEAAIVAGVLRGLTPAQVADAVVAALPDELAARVVDELAERIRADGGDRAQ